MFCFKNHLMLTVSILALGVAACNNHHAPLTTTDVQTGLIEHSPSRARAHLNDMADNAMLKDMSVADIHFVPHTSEISGTGAERLTRMSALLNTYGGTVRYETYLQDKALLQQRLDHVGEFLAVTGCDMNRVDVKAMMSGGSVMSAAKAVNVDNKGTAKPGKSGGAGGLGIMMPTTGQAPKG